MRRSQDGLALLVTVGILTLLAVSGAAWARLAVSLRETAGMALDRTQARLLARAGVEYASSRLSQDSLARTPQTADNQSEDWTFRDGPGTLLETARNPSYAHSEPYRDLDADGRYREGVDSYADADGNSRFDFWSGRLRDRHGMTGGTFALKVLGESGKINLNGGWLDAEDREHVVWTDAAHPAYVRNGVPDHRDVDEVRNRRYVLLLDTLGQIAGVSDTRAAELQNGAASRLGDLLGRRPYRGFQTMGQVEGALSALKRPGDWPKVRDFLTVTETERAKFSVSDKLGMGMEDATFMTREFVRRLGNEARPLVNLGAASRETLQALTLGLSISIPPNGARWIDPALASRTADYLSQGRFASGYDFYGKLYRDNPAVDPESAGYEVALRPAALAGSEDLGASQSWANVLFGNLGADEPGGYAGIYDSDAISCFFWSPPMSWHTYDLPHASASSPPRFHYLFKMGPSEMPDRNGTKEGMDKIERRQGGRPPVPPGIPGAGFRETSFYTGGTLEVSLIPREVFAFSIDCLGSSRTGSGRPQASFTASALFHFGEVVSARTQEEFENRGEARLAGHCRVIGRPVKDRTQTEPQFSVDSLPEAVIQAYRDLRPDGPLYSPFWGTVRLADRSGYRRGERFYVPAWDADQPLRPKSDPAFIEDSFQDVSEASKFVYKWNPDPSGVDDIPSSDAIFRGARASSFNCGCAPEMSAPGAYRWLSGKRFALDDGSGNVTRGAIELWTTGRPGGLLYRRLGLHWTASNDGTDPDIEIRNAPSRVPVPFNVAVPSPETTLQPSQITVNSHLSSPLLVGDWHHLVVALDSAPSPAGSASAMVGYLDGRPDPFLANDDWAAGAINTTYPPRWEIGSGVGAAVSTRGGYLASEVDELRLYDRPLDQGEAMARALSSRYWTEERFPPSEWPQEIVARLRRVPSFTSPFYLFDRPVVPQGAHWNGFVPQLIREAVDGPAGAAQTLGPSPGVSPMRVELLCYPGPDPEGPCRAVPFPEGLWRTGGGWADFAAMWKSAYGDEPVPRFRAFRYKVWMDCSAIEGLNIETPVFDSISLAFRTGGKLLDLAAE